jgi:hypothetical protein
MLYQKIEITFSSLARLDITSMNPEMVLAAKVSILAMRTQTLTIHFTLTQETTFNFHGFHLFLKTYNEM